MSEQKNTVDDKNKKELSWGEKIAEQIAGDNEMVKGAIKFLTHPLVICTGGIAILFWLFKGKEQKDKMENLKKENEELQEQLNGLEEKFGALKEKHQKLRSRSFMPEDDDEDERNDSMSGRYERSKKRENRHENLPARRGRYRSSYLD